MPGFLRGAPFKVWAGAPAASRMPKTRPNTTAAGASVEDLPAATRAFEDTEPEADRYRAEALNARVQTVADAAAEEMSTELMDAAMADLRTIPHPTTAQK